MLIMHQQVRSPKSAFLQAKATDHVETMMITVNEVNSKETKIPKEFILRSVLLACFTAAPKSQSM